jgi:predicted RNA methylase
MQTAPSRQAVLGQFFTPAGIADFMADLFTPPDGPVRLLDAGAGKGALTRAFIDRWRGTTAIVSDAYEVDAEVLAALEAGLGKVTEDGVSPHVIATDFIEAAATMIRLDRGPRYTRAILNPPYRKIATGSRERRLAAAAGLETVNLYSAFVGLALDLMQAGGELVAIIPRSFCNGPYYLPFRKWLFGRAALRRVHLFGSRRDAFAGDGVLQENVIIMLERGGEQGDVLVSTSTGSGFEDLAVRTHRFVEIVEPGDPDQVINIPTGDAVVGNGATATLADLGLHVATGPVVDFRLRDHLRREHEEGDAPLLYPQHLKHGRITWPVEGKKPNAISCNDATGKWLIPSGWYVLVKRFSSKEERRRVVATLCDPATLPGKTIGIDNKLNLIRHGKRPLPEDLARGLAIYLNTSDVDRAFRLFSGHTQVNASDLRRMKFPSWTQLEMIGRAAATARPSNQDAIDSCVAAVLDN